MNKLNNTEALQITTVIPTMKKSLLALAVAGTMAMSGYSMAAAGTTEIADGQTRVFDTANNAAGLLESNATAAVGIILDSTGGIITLGADGTESVSITSAAAGADLTMTITTSGTANGVVFADDLDAAGDAGTTIVINATNDNITFEGNIEDSVGETSADINIGAAGGNPTLTMTVDTKNNENLSIKATIDAVDAADNVTLAITNTDSENPNTITFVDAIGGSVGIDAVTLGSNTTTTFTGAVTATTITNSSANVTTFNDDATGVLTFGADGTSTFAADKKIVGSVTTATTNTGTLTFATATDNLIAVSGNVGASGKLLKVVNILSDDTASDANEASIGGNIFATTINATATVTSSDTVEFAGTVNGTTVNLLGAGATSFLGDVTSNVVFGAGASTTGTATVAANKKIVGAVTTTDTGEGTLTFAVATSDTTLASSTIGATDAVLKAVNIVVTDADTTDSIGVAATMAGNIFATGVNATATLATDAEGDGDTVAFSGTVDATTLTLTGDGSFTFADTVTATTVLVDDSIVTVAANKGFVGAVQNKNDEGTIAFATTTQDTTLASLLLGQAANDELKAVNATVTSGTATFGGDVFATTVTTTATDSTGSDTIAFGDKVTATTLNLDGAGAFTFADTVTAAVVISGDSTSTVAANVIVVGAVTNDGTTGEGTLTFATTTATTTLANSTIGATSAVLKAVNATSTAATATFSGDVFATTVTATATDSTDSDTIAFGDKVTATTLNLDGAGAFTFADTVTAAVVISGDSTSTVAADVIVVGAVSNDGTTGEGTLTFAASTGDFTLASTTIGATGALLKEVNIVSTSGNTLETATLGGNIFATTVNTTSTVTAEDAVTFAGTINGTTINLLGAGATNFQGDVTAAVVFGAGASTSAVLTVSADKKIVGAVTTATTDQGTLTFAATTANTTLASSTIGATAKLLEVVNVTSTANTATLAGNVFATTVTATATDTTDSDSIAFGGSVTGDTLTLVGTGTFKFDDVVTTAVDANLIDGAKIILTKGIASGDTVFAATQEASALAGASVGAVVVTMPETLNTGSINFIDYVGATTGAADAALLTVGNSKLATYAAAIGSDSTIAKITATAKSAATIASELSITTDQANALYNATTSAAGTASSLTAIDTVLNATVTESNVEQLQPDAGAANGAALAAVGGVNNVISGRQANTRVAFNTLGNQSGVSTGDAANDVSVWAQIFGSTATQDRVGTIDGYEADSQGLALGWEADKSGDVMGLSVSYSDADVDGKSASASHTDTTATQVSAYGTYGQATDWMVGYASADNDTKRTTLDGTASGKYDSAIFSAKVGHAFASSNTGTWTMTPKVDASYTNIDNDGYTETGANAFNLIVASSSNDILTARAGAEFTQRIVDGDAVTIPHVNIMAGYDLSNDGASTTSTFTGGGAAFTTTAADPEKASLQLGFGVDHVSDDSTVSLDLNADLRSDYDSMSGSITFKSKF